VPNQNFIGAKRGRALLRLYIRLAKVSKADAKCDYTITDAIVTLMKLARHRKHNAEALLESAQAHFDAETTICPDCGREEDPDQHQCRAKKPKGQTTI